MESDAEQVAPDDADARRERLAEIRRAASTPNESLRGQR